MAKKSNICASIEGKRISFNTRQFYQYTPYVHEHLGVKVFPFKLGINGYAEIESSLEDLSKVVFETSMLEVGDSIQGGSVEGWATKAIGKTEVINRTATHKAEAGNLRGHAYAHVQSPHRDHLQSEDIMARHPELPQVLNPIYKTEPGD
ncbi:hypothetical protein U737_11825 [Methylomonas sp. LW13]|uniref:hypothetical protein n=1 Tax=unclassified Methylomonas TaxID=2608980 RepID=UPI00051C9F4B|nr:MULTISPECIES: hypothetical protein [unclassified Methylomonas]PKD40918.1 hypothetical protein CWO84_08615 [Methylomonas sp. Kb3]QBC27532.1 hypothetical protein U737_11825 [Methylomonas sp. LW13]